jgi:hypothetical protein
MAFVGKEMNYEKGVPAPCLIECAVSTRANGARRDMAGLEQALGADALAGQNQNDARAEKRIAARNCPSALLATFFQLARWNLAVNSVKNDGGVFKGAIQTASEFLYSSNSYKADQHEQEGGFSQVLANRFPEKPDQQPAH